VWQRGALLQRLPCQVARAAAVGAKYTYLCKQKLTSSRVIHIEGACRTRVRAQPCRTTDQGFVLLRLQVTVELKNDLAINGTLHSVDQYMNIKLDNVKVVNEDKFPHMVRSLADTMQAPDYHAAFVYWLSLLC
jgi:small nuclear ribonucleoprotein (snRNP)-like protein